MWRHQAKGFTRKAYHTHLVVWGPSGQVLQQLSDVKWYKNKGMTSRSEWPPILIHTNSEEPDAKSRLYRRCKAFCGRQVQRRQSHVATVPLVNRNDTTTPGVWAFQNLHKHIFTVTSSLHLPCFASRRNSWSHTLTWLTQLECGAGPVLSFRLWQVSITRRHGWLNRTVHPLTLSMPNALLMLTELHSYKLKTPPNPSTNRQGSDHSPLGP